MTPPEGLGEAGAALWSRIVEPRAAAGWLLDEREAAILSAACRQADDIAGLEAEIVSAGRMVEGSRGQPVLNPAITEVRQGRLALGRLLGQLALPDGEDVPRSAAGQRGQRAARSRWSRQRGGATS